MAKTFGEELLGLFDLSQLEQPHCHLAQLVHMVRRRARRLGLNRRTLENRQLALFFFLRKQIGQARQSAVPRMPGSAIDSATDSPSSKSVRASARAARLWSRPRDFSLGNLMVPIFFRASTGSAGIRNWATKNFAPSSFFAVAAFHQASRTRRAMVRDSSIGIGSDSFVSSRAGRSVMRVNSTVVS